MAVHSRFETRAGPFAGTSTVAVVISPAITRYPWFWTVCPEIVFPIDQTTHIPLPPGPPASLATGSGTCEWFPKTRSI